MSVPTILIPGKINQRVVDQAGLHFDIKRIDTADIELLTDAERPDIVGIASSTKLTSDFMSGLPSLEIIAHFGVGYDPVDVNHAVNQNVMVTNTPDVLSDEVADVTIGLLINTIRELAASENYLRAGRWANEGNYPLTKLSLRNRHVGIYGLGRIGLEIARRLEGFGVDISYYSRNQKSGVDYNYCSSLLKLANTVDTMICIVPGGAATDRSINDEVFKALGSNGVFINVGRGSTVDEDAMIAALEAGTIAAAGLDVFADEPNVPEALIAMDNVCLLPHVASASIHTRNAMADLQVQNLINWFSGKDVVSPVVETQHIKRF